MLGPEELETLGTTRGAMSGKFSLSPAPIFATAWTHRFLHLYEQDESRGSPKPRRLADPSGILPAAQRYPLNPNTFRNIAGRPGDSFSSLASAPHEQFDEGIDCLVKEVLHARLRVGRALGSERGVD